MDDLKRNASYCLDPTAERAIKHIERENKRFNDLLNHIFYICKLAGFSIEGRIVLRDKKSGRVWR